MGWAVQLCECSHESGVEADGTSVRYQLIIVRNGYKEILTLVCEKGGSRNASQQLREVCCKTLRCEQRPIQFEI